MCLSYVPRRSHVGHRRARAPISHVTSLMSRILSIVEVVSLDSGSSGSVDNPVPVNLDCGRILRLAEKIMELLCRKNKGRSDPSDFATEYWAIRLAALFYESAMNHPIFDNESEIVDFLKSVVFGNPLG